MIADDEYLIRDGLARKIDWPGLGFGIVETAENGLEVLELISKNRPDLILMDIRMPFMDGLELIEKVKIQDQEICVVIISGHEEFAYAKTALQFDAFDYILKPINLKELEKVLIKARTHLEQQRAAHQEIVEIRRQVEISIPVLKERFILDIISGRLAEDRIRQDAGHYGFEVDDFFSTALIDLEAGGTSSCSSTDNQKKLEIYFFDTLNNEHHVFISTISPNEYLLLVSGGVRGQVEEVLKETVSNIFGVGKSNGLGMTISTGPTVDTLTQLPASYKNALLTLSGKFFSGGNRILYHSRVEQDLQAENLDFFDISGFRQALTFADKKTCMAELRNLRAMILAQDKTPKLVLQLLCFNIFFECKKAIQELGAEINDILQDPFSFFHDIVSLSSGEALFDRLEALLSLILDYHDTVRLNQYSCDIDKAKKFIKSNYKDVTLCLKSMAEHVNVSACHFSVIFKKKTGVTYIQYLTDIRINRAKELLLNSDMKVYEVAFEVGYENPTYFSTLFKKLTGIPPADYRRQIITHQE
ncbi:MAG: hypothetical protein A3J97_05660 [Spirochaetes bacterium RIFOXYC1_FULL_54_7]|nr:MAG: hypothetical protein A3J97_05660 [Spirochaetes bacterium RIFOXYC1_FULL_54_7]